MGIRSRIGYPLAPRRGRGPSDRGIMGRARLLPRSSLRPAPVELRGGAADVPAGSTAGGLRVAGGGAGDRLSRVPPPARPLAAKPEAAPAARDARARDH